MPFKKIFSTGILIVFFAVCFSIFIVPKAYADISISTCTQLQDINLDLTENYNLTGDIDCSVTSGWNAGKGFIPIGNDNNGNQVGYFQGSFDGNDHTISNLTIVRPDQDAIGLFARVDHGTFQPAGGTFQDVTITGTIEGHSLVGALAGYAQGTNTVTVNNVTSSVVITAHEDYIGGLIGDAAGPTDIIDSTASGNITVNATDILIEVGGLVGHVGDSDSTISGSIASGNLLLTSTANVGSSGGLTGDFYGSSITGSSASGNITITSGNAPTYIGGLSAYFGDSSSTVADSSASGDITINNTGDGSFSQYVGGFIGDFEGNTVTGSDSTGDIILNAGIDYINYVGGFIGFVSNGAISTSTVTSNITITSSSLIGIHWIGGFAGKMDGTLTDVEAGGTLSITSDPGSGDVNYVGGMVGEYFGNVTVAITSVDIDITADDAEIVGGFFGYNSSTSQECEATGDITINDAGNVDYVGGLVGTDLGSTFGDSGDDTAGCNYSGAIMIDTQNGSNIAGLIGGDFFGTIYASNTSGSITIFADEITDIGGLLNYSFGTVYDSVSSMDISITSTSLVESVGGFMSTHGGSILDGSSSGDITIVADLVDIVGGLIGENSAGAISGGHSSGLIDITAFAVDSGVGGFIGSASDLFTENTYSTVDILIESDIPIEGGVGGFIGYTTGDSTINTSYASGDITATTLSSFVDYVGGFIGYANGPTDVINCFSVGNIGIDSADYVSHVGGLIGNWDFGSDLNVINSYSANNITVTAVNAIDSVGGLIGSITVPLATVNDAWSAGLVSTAGSGETNIGGFIGNYDVATTFSNNYYDKTTSTQALCTGIDDPDPAWCTDETDPEIFKSNDDDPIFTAWDFATIWLIDDCDYPVLIGLPSPYSTTGCSPAVPTVISPTSTSIATTSATLGANVTSLGIPASISARGTCLATTPTPTTNCVAEGGTTLGVFTHSRTGLTPATLYYYRGYATNTTGTGYSADATFTTDSLGGIVPPTVTTRAAKHILKTSATLEGTINSTGGENAITRGIYWGTTTAYGNTTVESGSFGTGLFSDPISPILCGTTYHFQAYAANSAGTGVGEDRTFNTTSCGGTGGNNFRNPTDFTVTSYAGPGGSISPLGVFFVHPGESKSFQVTSFPGYRISEIKVNGSGATLSAGNTYQFSNIQENKTIEAYFAAIPTVEPPVEPPCTGPSCNPCVGSSCNPCVGPSCTPDNPPEEPPCTGPSCNPCVGPSCIPDNPDNPPNKPPCVGSSCNPCLGPLCIPDIPDTPTVKVVPLIPFALLSLLNLFAMPLTLGELVYVPGRIWNLVLVTLKVRKKVFPWGTVYDSVTKQPIDPAFVTVALASNNSDEVSDAITDIDGRYGFLLPQGSYQVTAGKTHYQFPSKNLAGKKSDILYDNLYFGEPFTVSPTDPVIHRNIPLDPVNFDWNEFEKGKKHLMNFYSRRELWIHRIADILFGIGFIFSILSEITRPSLLNTLILLLYVGLFAIARYYGKPRSYGTITVNGQILSFAIVRVFNENHQTEITHKVADAFGRYFCLVPPEHSYYVTIEGKNPDGSYTKIFESDIIRAKTGIIKEDFKLG